MEPVLPHDHLNVSSEKHAKWAKYMLQFKADHPLTNQVMAYFETHLVKKDLVTWRDERYKHVMLVSTTEKELVEEAEYQQLLKRRKDTGDMEELVAADCDKYESGTVAEGPLLSPCENVYLLREMLERVDVEDDFWQLAGVQKSQGHNKNTSLVQAVQRLGILEYVGPVHETEWRKSIWKATVWSVFPPAKVIREYYGEGVALYFAWMSLYIKWLLVPGVLGWFIWYTRRGVSSTASSDPAMSLFAFAMVVWGFFFLKLWDRSAASHADLWGTLERSHILRDIRLSFYGDERVSEITGEKELHYPAWKRRCKYIVSFLVTGAMLAVAFSVMVALLNVQGYVSELRGSGRRSSFFILQLASLAKPGGLFDAKGNILIAKVPVLLHAIMIFVLNQKIYRPIAIALTEWENHRTDEEYENALALKRFIFDAFDCYIALFYLAFFECDIDRLRTELAALFVSDCIRRVLTETLIPFVIRVFKRRSQQHQYEAHKKTDSTEPASADEDDHASSAQGVRVTSLDLGKPYEQFDEYLEMVIQYGYIMLFASAFPLAASAALITTAVEVKSDGVKLAFVTRRPQIQRARNIGVWHKLIVAQTWLAILTNTIIFGFSSHQMAHWFPWTSVDSLPADVDSLTIYQHGLRAAGLAFGLEHVLVICGLVVIFSISSVPVSVKKRSLTRQYHRYTQLQQLRKQSKIAEVTVKWQKINLKK